MATLGKDIDKNDVEAYLTSPRRRSVVIDDERCVEIPIQMNPQLDASKLRSVAGRPPTPIPSDEEDEDEEDQQQQQSSDSVVAAAAADNTVEGKLGSGEHLPLDKKLEEKVASGKVLACGQGPPAALESPEPPAEGSRH